MEQIPVLVKEHIEMNIGCETYRDIPGEMEFRDGKWGYFVNWSKVREWHVKKAELNLELIKNRCEEREKLTTIQCGDYIEYKDGRTERVTHVWEHDVQAGGGSSSFYMAKNGHASYSGSLNSGLKKSQLQDSGQKSFARFWFFSEDWSGANRAISFYCMVRIWQER